MNPYADVVPVCFDDDHGSWVVEDRRGSKVAIRLWPESQDPMAEVMIENNDLVIEPCDTGLVGKLMGTIHVPLAIIDELRKV